jgi:hypothetical protein
MSRAYNSCVTDLYPLLHYKLGMISPRVTQFLRRTACILVPISLHNARLREAKFVKHLGPKHETGIILRWALKSERCV